MERQLILIVEDEKVNRAILKKILSQTYDVIEAENGEIGFDMLISRRTEISAVLLDVMMPIMNGFGFLKKLGEANITDMPVIVTTGYSDSESEQKVLDAGAWDFTSKPYNPKVLMSRLRNAIARSQETAFNKLKYMSEHDELTDLYNRRKMFAETLKMISNNQDQDFAFIRLDIDHFALFNTSFGEAEGDRLLRFVADCIREISTPKKLVTYGRMNADIFCACFQYDRTHNCLEENVLAIQKKISEFRNDYLLEISVGVCFIDDNSNAVIDDYYFRSTTASEDCKNKYQTHISYYDKSYGEQLSKEITITNEMQKALDEEQFVVYLQPKFNLSTETICGAEALVRWIHPVKGLVSPGEFIPVFEKNGFISKLDYYVWEKTCQMIRGWLNSGCKIYPVSVNISRISLYNPELVDNITGLVKKYKIPTSLFQLEITESAYMTNPELMESTIDALHDSGFVILMDDFGSGYSSLNTLKRIKVDVLKVDMKFMPVKEETERAEIILACVIKMANWLGMEVVVEGVETRRQRDFLEGAGCESVQGYYYSKPVAQDIYEEKYIFVQPEETADNDNSNKNDVTPRYNRIVLAIDDSEVDREILHTNLRSLFHVHMCDSAESGLAYLKQNSSRVRLVLVDNIMPGMSGLDFLKYCNNDAALKSIPKIMITADDNVNDQVEAFRAGAYDYITKPLSKEVILARVNHVMDICRQSSMFNAVEMEYQKNAERDSMTGLLNKMSFNDIATRVIEKMPEEKEAMFVIDIDNFKHINDTYGHLMGDSIINAVADELKNQLRKTDIIGRFGGDEYVVLMTQLNNRDIARRKASEIIKSTLYNCRKKFEIPVSISIGISHFEKGDNINTMFARADQALYEAKSTGKGKLVTYGEKVPPIIDDDKPIIIICSDDSQLYPVIALSYGDEAGFAQITSMAELKEAHRKYSNRIKVICIDMQKKVCADADEFYDYILSMGGGDKISLIVVCQEGNIEQYRDAMKLKLSDIITIPPQIDSIQRRLALALSK